MRTGALETQLSMDAAMERAEDWAGRARGIIEDWFPGHRFVADDIRHTIGDPPAHGDALGAVLRNAKKAGLIRYTGEQVISSRPEAHGRYLRVWIRT